MLVRLVDKLLRIDVALEVVGDQVVVTVVNDAVHQSAELAGVAESAAAHRLEDTLELRIDLEAAVEVAVTKVFDVLGKVAEEEDIVLSDFAGDLVIAVSDAIFKLGSKMLPRYSRRRRYR